MPFETKWYVPERIVTAYNWGVLTLDEMRATNVEMLAMIRSGTAPVHLLVDTRDVTKMPSSFIPMLKEIEPFRNETKTGWSVMVTNSSLMHFFGLLSSNLVKSPYGAVHNYEEANALLERVDPSLKGLLPQNWEAKPPVGS